MAFFSSNYRFRGGFRAIETLQLSWFSWSTVENFCSATFVLYVPPWRDSDHRSRLGLVHSGHLCVPELLRDPSESSGCEQSQVHPPGSLGRVSSWGFMLWTTTEDLFSCAFFCFYMSKSQLGAGKKRFSDDQILFFLTQSVDSAIKTSPPFICSSCEKGETLKPELFTRNVCPPSSTGRSKATARERPPACTPLHAFIRLFWPTSSSLESLKISGSAQSTKEENSPARATTSNLQVNVIKYEL